MPTHPEQRVTFGTRAGRVIFGRIMETASRPRADDNRTEQPGRNDPPVHPKASGAEERYGGCSHSSLWNREDMPTESSKVRPRFLLVKCVGWSGAAGSPLPAACHSGN
jgi:hypothetical protein